MKLSVHQWLSVAIVLPLITSVLNSITPANAYSSHRANSVGSEQANQELIDQKSARITTPSRTKVKLKFTKHLNQTRVRKTHKYSDLKARSSRKSDRAYLRLVATGHRRTNKIGNPIYRLEAYANGKKYRAFKAVTGTAFSQNKNRHRANSLAPLPDGAYKVMPKILRGHIAEVGRTFVPIYPRFKTSRSDLGVHLDPSYNKRNGSDGTAGCIGLTTARDRDAFNKYVKKFRPHKLIVRIMR
jgi:hypothetical protein